MVAMSHAPRMMCKILTSLKYLLGQNDIQNGIFDDGDWNEDDMENEGQTHHLLSKLLSHSGIKGSKRNENLIQSIFRCVREASWTDKTKDKTCQALGPNVLEKWRFFLEGVHNGNRFPLPRNCMSIKELHKSIVKATRPTIRNIQQKR